MARAETLWPSFMEEWPCKIVGLGLSKPTYNLYVAALVTVYGYFLVMTTVALYYAIPDVKDCISGFFMFMSINWVIFVTVLKIITARSFFEMIEMIKSGVYRYENEDYDVANEEIARKVHNSYRRLDKTLVRSGIVSYILVMIGSPLCGYLFDREVLDSIKNPVVNPYLPHFYYSPFDTSTLSGFAIAYSIDLVMWCIGSTSTIFTIKIMMVMLAQMVLQLKILNHSLVNIERRALSLYRKKVKCPTQADLLDTKEFNDCLHSCLKSSIQHHQTLLRYKHVIQPYLGSILLSFFSAFVVVIFAALLYLLLLKQPVSVRIKYLAMFVPEQFCTFFVCIFGENVISESGVMFENLYSMSWFNYNRDFKQTLHIMMTHVREPIKHRAYFLEASASMESYGELVKGTYSLTNLLVPAQGT